MEKISLIIILISSWILASSSSSSLNIESTYNTSTSRCYSISTNVCSEFEDCAIENSDCVSDVVDSQTSIRLNLSIVEDNITLPLTYQCYYIGSSPITGTSASTSIVLEYDSPLSRPFVSELDCQITDSANLTFQYIHNTTQRFVEYDSGFRQSDIDVSSIEYNTWSGGSNLGSVIDFSDFSRFADTSSAVLSFRSSSDNSLLYSNPSLRLNVTSSVPSIPSDALVYVAISSEQVRVSSAVTSRFLPIDTEIPSIVSNSVYFTSTRDPNTVLGINDTIYFHFNTSVGLAVEPSCVLGDTEILSVYLDTSTHVIASYEISASSVSSGDLVCELRSQANNTVSNLTVFEDVLSSSGYTIYDSLPSVTSVLISGLDSEGASLGNSRPLHFGMNDVLVMTLSSVRSLSGTCTINLGDTSPVVNNVVNFTVTTSLSSPLPVSCQVQDETGMSVSYDTSISSDIVKVDVVAPVLTDAFFLNVSDPHPINSELYLGIVFDAYESSIAGSCDLEIRTNSVLEQTLKLVIQENQNSEVQVFSSNGEEVYYFLRHVVRMNDTSIGSNQHVFLNCTYEDKYGNVGTYANNVAQNITVDASRPTLTVGRIFSSDGAVARVGSTVTIVLSTSESLMASDEGCVVNDVSGLPIVSGGSGDYQIVYVIQDGDNNAENSIAVDCIFLDEAGNSNDIHDVYTMNFRIDATLPRFESNVAFVSSNPLKQGDRVEIFLNLENPEEDDGAVSLVQCEVNGHNVNSTFQRASSGIYAVTHTVEDGESWEAGEMGYDCTLSDEAGNQYRSTSLGNNVYSAVIIESDDEVSVSSYLPASTLSLGFFLITVSSYTLGELVPSVGLPKISAYILVGIAAGPYILELIERRHLENLRLVDEIALTFIALAAGSKLDISALYKESKAIAWITTFLVIVEYLVGVVMFLAFSGTLDLFDGMDSTQQLAVAMLGGTLMTARSPSSALAIVDETGAKGKFTTLVLLVTILMDVTVIVLYDINAMIAEIQLGGTGALPLGESIAALFVSFVVAIAGGTMFGYAFPHLVFWKSPVRRKSGLAKLVELARAVLLLGMGFAFFLLSHATNSWFEPLVFLMVASAVASNFTEASHKLKRTLKASSIWVYVPFFTLSGASLDLDMLAQAIGIAFVLFFSRVLAIAAGSIIGLHVSNTSGPYQKFMWMAFVTQAGVTLGLSKKISLEYSGWGPQFNTVIVAVVILNQFVGPFLMKFAILSAGEAHGGGKKNATDQFSTDPYYRKFHNRLVRIVVERGDLERNFDGDSVRRRLACHGMRTEILTYSKDENISVVTDRIDKDLVAFVAWTCKETQLSLIRNVSLICDESGRDEILPVVCPSFGNDDSKGRDEWVERVRGFIHENSEADAVDVRMVRLDAAIGELLDRAITNRGESMSIGEKLTEKTKMLFVGSELIQKDKTRGSLTRRKKVSGGDGNNMTTSDGNGDDETKTGGIEMRDLI